MPKDKALGCGIIREYRRTPAQANSVEAAAAGGATIIFYV